MSIVNKDNVLPICVTIILSCFHIGAISSMAVVGGTSNLIACGFLAACKFLRASAHVCAMMHSAVSKRVDTAECIIAPPVF